MKRPAFQFYPADWRNNAKLRRCSEAARGVWIDVLCLMHDSDEYGVLRWPLAEIARAAGVPLKLLKELAEREVIKGGDKGCDGFIHTPIHARKPGEPIILLHAIDQPCWYSSRFLVDEWRRSVQGASTRFQSPNHSPTHGKVNGDEQKTISPNHSPTQRQSDGATSSSSSESYSVSKDTGEKPPKTPDEIIFGYGVPLLTNAGVPEKQARSFLGGLRKHHGDEAVINALRGCIKTKPLQPLEWLAAALPPPTFAKKEPPKFRKLNGHWEQYDHDHGWFTVPESEVPESDRVAA